MITAELAEKFEDDVDIINELKELANNTKKSFNEKFYNKKNKCLYDVLGDVKLDQINYLLYH